MGSRAQRDRLLARAPGSVEELAERAARGGSSSDEYLLWEEIRSINLLLGEDCQVAAAEKVNAVDAELEAAACELHKPPKTQMLHILTVRRRG